MWALKKWCVTKVAHCIDKVQFVDGSSLIMGGSRGGTGVLDPLENRKKYSFFGNTGPDPIENLKAQHVLSQHYITDHHQSSGETPFK